MKVVTFIGLVVLSLSQLANACMIFNSNGQQLGTVEASTIFRGNQQVGGFEGDAIFRGNGQQIGTVQGNAIYRGGQQVGLIQGDRILGADGQQAGRAYQCNTRQAAAGALVLKLLTGI